MNWQQETESAYLLDLSAAANSVQAFQLLEEFLKGLPNNLEHSLTELNASDLLLTRGVVTRMSQQLRAAGLHPHIFYAILPQTQQAALDEGWLVKLKPNMASATRHRQSLEEALQPRQKMGASSGARNNNHGIELPSFGFNPASPPRQGAINLKSKPNSTVLSLNKRSQATTFELKNDASMTTTEPEGKKAPLLTKAQSVFNVLSPQTATIPELGTPLLEPENPSSDIDSSAEFHEGVLTALQQEGSSELRPGELREVEYSDAALQTLYWRQNLRSGQTLRFEGNIVIIGDVHAGSEVTAGGDIIIWGELRGVTHAGAQGNFKAEIRAMRIEALQLRISDYIARRPDRIYYHKDENEGSFAPEIARVADGEIKIYKTRSTRV